MEIILHVIVKGNAILFASFPPLTSFKFNSYTLLLLNCTALGVAVIKVDSLLNKLPINGCSLNYPKIRKALKGPTLDIVLSCSQDPAPPRLEVERHYGHKNDKMVQWFYFSNFQWFI